MPSFRLHATLTCGDRSLIVQSITYHDGDWWTTQDGGPAGIVVTRHTPDGPQVLGVIRAEAHGDRGFRIVPGSDGPVVHLADRLGRDIAAQLPAPTLAAITRQTSRKIPLGDGLHRLEVPTDRLRPIHYYDAADRRLFRTRRYAWEQGQVAHAGRLYTLRGSPRDDRGWRYPTATNVLPYVEVRQYGQRPRGLILPKIRVDRLGYTAAGTPTDGKVEPEGLTVAELDGTAQLVVGISTGVKGRYRLQLWTRPI